jgi:hypothetical protein
MTHISPPLRDAHYIDFLFVFCRTNLRTCIQLSINFGIVGSVYIRALVILFRFIAVSFGGCRQNGDGFTCVQGAQLDSFTFHLRYSAN